MAEWETGNSGQRWERVSRCLEKLDPVKVTTHNTSPTLNVHCSLVTNLPGLTVESQGAQYDGWNTPVGIRTGHWPHPGPRAGDLITVAGAATLGQLQAVCPAWPLPGQHRPHWRAQSPCSTWPEPGGCRADCGDMDLALITTGWAGLSSFVWAQSNTDPCSNPFNIYLTLQCVLLYAACLISVLSKVP